MTKTTLAFSPLVVLILLLINFQGSFAQDDLSISFTCFVSPGDPMCLDWDQDGVIRAYEEKQPNGNDFDPCVPDKDSDTCKSQYKM